MSDLALRLSRNIAIVRVAMPMDGQPGSRRGTWPIGRLDRMGRRGAWYASLAVAVAVVTAGPLDERIAIGMRRAEAYNSKRCKSLRERASESKIFTRWVGPGARTSDLVLSATVPTATVAAPLRGGGGREKTQVVYVANQKAASTTFTKEMKGIFHGAAIEARCACLKGQCDGWDRTCPPRRRRAEGPMAPAARGAVAFTVVHDPLHVFWAGIIQSFCHERLEAALKVVRTHENIGGVQIGRFLFKNQTYRSSVPGLEVLIDDLLKGRFLGEPIFHAWPQALKVDTKILDVDGAEVPLTFVGDLAHLGDDLRASFRGTTPANLNPPRDNVCEAAVKANIKKLSKNATRGICSLVDIDYECFDWPRPPECPTTPSDGRRARRHSSRARTLHPGH